VDRGKDLPSSFSHFPEELIVGGYQSPILGQKKIPSKSLGDQEPVIMNYAFRSEDSDILAHNTDIQNRIAHNANKMSSKRSGEDVQSTYSWSDSPSPDDSKGIPP
jgi:hypothetical protein